MAAVSKGSPRACPGAWRRLYRLRIPLRAVRAAVWRRVLVAPETTLSELHAVFQAGMGWEHFHQWRFGSTLRTDGRVVDGSWWETFVDDEGHGHAAERVSLHRLGLRTGDRFAYHHELGDEWVHDVRVGARPERKPGRRHPCVIDGRGACPPEDRGGPELHPVLVRPAVGKGPVEGPLRGCGISRTWAREELGIVRSWRSSDPASFGPSEANGTPERRLA